MDEEVQKTEVQSEEAATEVAHDKPSGDPQAEQVSDNTEEKGSDKPADDQANDSVVNKPAEESSSEIPEQAKSSDPGPLATEAASTDKSEDAIKEPLTKDASNGEAGDENKENQNESKVEGKLPEPEENESAKTSARDPTPECTMKDPQADNEPEVTNVQEDANPEDPCQEEPSQETKEEPSQETKEEPSQETKAKAEPLSDSNQSHGPSPDGQKTGHSQLSHATFDSELLSPPPHNISVINRTAHPTRNGINNAMSLNKMAIAASAQNKLPVSRLKGILERVGRHTESSAKKRGNWYKSESSYVDVNSYSWKNLSLYKDYQQHMWKGDGTVKSSCKK